MDKKENAQGVPSDASPEYQYFAENFKPEPVDLGPKKKGIGRFFVGALQILAFVPLYLYVAVKAFMAYASDDAYDLLLEYVDFLELKDMADNEVILNVCGFIFVILALVSLSAGVLWMIGKKLTKVIAFYMTVLLLLLAVVLTALYIAFDGNKFYMLAALPHYFINILALFYYFFTEKKTGPKVAKDKKQKVKAGKKSKIKTTAKKEVITKTIVLGEEAVAQAQEIEEEEQEESEEEEYQVIKIRKKPVPVIEIFYWLIAAINLGILGIWNTVGGLINFLATFSEDYDIIFQNYMRDFEIRDIELTALQVRSVFAIHSLAAFVFIVLGIGLLFRSQIFARLNKYYCGILIVMMFLSLILQGFSSFNLWMGLYFGFMILEVLFFNISKMEHRFLLEKQQKAEAKKAKQLETKQDK